MTSVSVSTTITGARPSVRILVGVASEGVDDAQAPRRRSPSGAADRPRLWIEEPVEHAR